MTDSVSQSRAFPNSTSYFYNRPQSQENYFLSILTTNITSPRNWNHTFISWKKNVKMAITQQSVGQSFLFLFKKKYNVGCRFKNNFHDVILFYASSQNNIKCLEKGITYFLTFIAFIFFRNQTDGHTDTWQFFLTSWRLSVELVWSSDYTYEYRGFLIIKI